MLVRASFFHGLLLQFVPTCGCCVRTPIDKEHKATQKTTPHALLWMMMKKTFLLHLQKEHSLHLRLLPFNSLSLKFFLTKWMKRSEYNTPVLIPGVHVGQGEVVELVASSRPLIPPPRLISSAETGSSREPSQFLASCCRRSIMPKIRTSGDEYPIGWEAGSS